jgi:hypothetical protein
MAGKNPFHLKELDIKEFKMILERHFRKVSFVSQKLHPQYVASKHNLAEEVAWLKLRRERLRSFVKSLGKAMLPGFVRKSLRNKRMKAMLNTNEKSLMEKIIMSSSDFAEADYFIGVCEGKR